MDCKKKTLAIFFAWLLMQLGAAVISCYIASCVAKQMFPNFWGYWGPSGMKVAFAELECLLFDMISTSIVGVVLLWRHKYGTRKYWIHGAVWYAVYLVATMSVIIYMANDWGVKGEYCFVEMSVMNCLYPVIAVLLLMAVIAAVRGIMRLIKKH